MPPTIVQQPAPTQAKPAATVSTTTPTTTQNQPAPNAAPIQEQPKESVIKRAASTQPAPAATPSNEAPKVSVSLDDVKDPVARQILEKKLEEANRGVSEAFGKIGAEKSKYLLEVEKLKAEVGRPWTPERLQQELSRQDFIQSATTLQNSVAPQGVDQEAWSSWTAQEKQAFQGQQSETRALKAQLEFMQQSQVLSAVDTDLKTEYPDYDPARVNEFYQKAQQNQFSPKEMREAIYWATNGKALVERAYALGLTDKATTVQEKINGMSHNGLNMTPTTSNTVERKPGERSSNVFASHGHKVLEMLRTMPRKN